MVRETVVLAFHAFLVLMVPVDKQPVSEDDYPEPLRPFLPEIEAFAQQNHFDILHPLLR
jgi:hypothetical protein